jgi:ankyrin repeat protein
MADVNRITSSHNRRITEQRHQQFQEQVQEKLRQMGAPQQQTQTLQPRQPFQQQIDLEARQEQQQQPQQQNGTQPRQSTTVGPGYDDDLSRISGFKHPAFTPSTPFELACCDGPLSAVQSILSSFPYTPSFLHHGLTLALSSGNLEVASCLLSKGAPIIRHTADNILSAPSDKQIPLFELLTHHGWTTNTPGFYGAVLLPRIVTNLPLLRWFLAHGADPNLGEQSPSLDRTGGPDTASCAALQYAAGHGDLEAVRMLLDAGAKIENGYPLHFAAGACPPDTNPNVARVKPSAEFDKGKIPVMALLVERGADVNLRKESRYVEPRYAIVFARMAGAVERVRWLLEQGADPHASASGAERVMYSEEMNRVIAEGVAARRWVKHDAESELMLQPSETQV